MSWIDRIKRNTPAAEETPEAQVPKPVLFEDGFDTPREDLEVMTVAYGLDLEQKGLIPKFEDIPYEFKTKRGSKQARRWRDLQETWWSKGLDKGTLIPREGIDVDDAWRHLRAIQGSFAVELLHKASAVAWLASRWFVFAGPIKTPKSAYTNETQPTKETR